jgi:F-type H+-transporting ATPase subunit a
MASAILHIKDSYYFEVPKFLSPANYHLRSDFPDVWVRLDPDYQNWEFERLYAALPKVFPAAPLPSKEELRDAWHHWQHADHANFAKPFDQFLREKHEANIARFEAWRSTGATKALKENDTERLQALKEATFGDYVAELKSSGEPQPENYLWYSQGILEGSGRKEAWREAVAKADDVAAYKRDPHVAEWSPEKIAAYNRHLSGKILIPQPFGKLRNLYEPESGFNISKFMVIEVAVALVLVVALGWLGKKTARGDRPLGKLWNLLESFFVFIRNNVAEPAIGHHDAHGFTPLLATIFFFVLGLNLCGMLPWVGSPTASFSVTLALAAVTLLTGVICGMQRFGFVGYFQNQIPHMDLAWPIAIIVKPMLFVIEMFGLVIKHLVLAIRLLANMFAGHVVLLGIMGVAFGVQAALAFTAPTGEVSVTWWIAAALAVLGSTLLSMLELFVAFLQAYVFTFLSALFIGAAIHHH